MNRTCIAVIDASRARLFTLDRTAEGGTIDELLLETLDLVNPAHRLARFEARQARTEEIDRAFARQISAELHVITRHPGISRLIVCASPHMLGELRQIGGYTRDGLAIDELARDLVKLTPPQLRERLTEYGLLPAA